MNARSAQTVLASPISRNLNTTVATSAVLSRSNAKQLPKRRLPTLVLASVTAITLGWSAIASAVTVSGLYNTGVNPGPTLFTGSGTLADGSAEPNYQLVFTSGGGSTTLRIMTSSDANFPAGWLADDSASTWIGPANNLSYAHSGVDGYQGTNDYRTTFTLSGAGTASISGQWTSDNYGMEIILDGGTFVGGSTPDGDWGVWTPFGFSVSGAGAHTLDFIVYNIDKNVWVEPIHKALVP